MPSKLKTGWKRIGRSGKTVDGRDIPKEALFEAAESYSPDLFTALIWPDHLRYFNMGKVFRLKAEDNNEGGADLFAELLPNDIYLSINKAGQRLFTSMELLPNFRDTGKWYLSGLAATDNPASAATSEIRFSAIDNDKALMGGFVENADYQFSNSNNDTPDLVSQIGEFFKSLLASNEGDMDKKLLEQFTTQMTELTTKVDAMGKQFSQEQASDDADDDANKAITLESIGKQVEELSAKLESFTAYDSDADDDVHNGVDAKKFEQLSSDLKKLQEEFTAALGEQPGTQAGEHGGGDTDLNSCL